MSGDRISEVVPKLSKARFIGINCITSTRIEAEVRLLRTLLPTSIRIIAYGNVGYPDDVKGWINTDAVDPDIHASYVQKWLSAGASIVGSCCGTGPDTTAAIKKLCFSDDDVQDSQVEVADNSTPATKPRVDAGSPSLAKGIEEKSPPVTVENETRKARIGMAQVGVAFLTIALAFFIRFMIVDP